MVSTLEVDDDLLEVVERVQRMPPNPLMVSQATGDLAEALRSSPEDPSFDLKTWSRQWADVEAELKAITQTNNAKEGRGV